MIINGNDVLIQINEDSILKIAEQNAYTRNFISHYTSFETLKLIFTDKTLKFNRIDQVNDKKEKNFFGNDELSNLVYVSCFTYDINESIPMWKIYGKNNNSVRISFTFNEINPMKCLLDEQGETISPTNTVIHRYEKSNIPNCDWYYTVNCKDVIYDISEIEKNPIRRKEFETGHEIFNLSAMGAIKRKEWGYEHETRFIAYLRSTRDNVVIPDIKFLLVPIKFNYIKAITITFNPWMSDDAKVEIKQFMYSIKFQNKVILRFEDSILSSEIL